VQAVVEEWDYWVKDLTVLPVQIIVVPYVAVAAEVVVVMELRLRQQVFLVTVEIMAVVAEATEVVVEVQGLLEVVPRVQYVLYGQVQQDYSQVQELRMNNVKFSNGAHIQFN
jgi:hypothetical protein